MDAARWCFVLICQTLLTERERETERGEEREEERRRARKGERKTKRGVY